jgi:ABC-type antimicrobial peptide transport system permease subunit
VSLAVVERRRGMGTLTAVDFASGQVLQTMVLENALLGIVGGVLGMAAVALAVILVNKMQPAAKMHYDVRLAGLMIVIAILVAALSSLSAAWQPTHQRPLEVLRDA